MTKLMKRYCVQETLNILPPLEIFDSNCSQILRRVKKKKPRVNVGEFSCTTGIVARCPIR